ncbi:hypothetical protein PN467_00010 [Microcystis aeruginosa CS-563/04]|uniref:hypothetical protein n=1 Tax=Microcystis aeruginosa TaxID=1126 RepID=UPI00232EC7B7|nr:hypothetical protein [Microcystis aeruginosa]MDB9418956.1 hypothetical protein [Microcystis aeruginosa CS-563/04]NCR10299.1 hypothetical protein [Microcystis aeruginosa LG13-11]
MHISLAELTAQLEDVESVLELEKAKAADIIPIAAQLLAPEKLALIKFLVSTLELV